MIQQGILRHKNAILEIARRHGATEVRIFGSRSRGESPPTSDLDVLVRLENGRSYLDLIALKQDLEDLLGMTVDVVTEAGISPYIRQEILEEAVPL